MVLPELVRDLEAWKLNPHSLSTHNVAKRLAKRKMGVSINEVRGFLIEDLVARCVKDCGVSTNKRIEPFRKPSFLIEKIGDGLMITHRGNYTEYDFTFTYKEKPCFWEMKIPPEQALGYPKLIVIFNLALVKPPMQASEYKTTSSSVQKSYALLVLNPSSNKVTSNQL